MALRGERWISSNRNARATAASGLRGERAMRRRPRREEDRVHHRAEQRGQGADHRQPGPYLPQDGQRRPRHERLEAALAVQGRDRPAGGEDRPQHHSRHEDLHADDEDDEQQGHAQKPPALTLGQAPGLKEPELVVDEGHRRGHRQAQRQPDQDNDGDRRASQGRAHRRHHAVLAAAEARHRREDPDHHGHHEPDDHQEDLLDQEEERQPHLARAQAQIGPRRLGWSENRAENRRAEHRLHEGGPQPEQEIGRRNTRLRLHHLAHDLRIGRALLLGHSQLHKLLKLRPQRQKGQDRGDDHPHGQGQRPAHHRQRLATNDAEAGCRRLGHGKPRHVPSPCSPGAQGPAQDREPTRGFAKRQPGV
ncbi:hypothetical protein CC_2597 [Caulobacter vibrioides CB15]|uniref:Uncharacterized protein n=1 Tax=Caulobacter vibrioides (strain ATCC 19089 / CIP 103742 / CB 15) TaxID=190650 RepID=Q9A567_CAUVC|nr:hypothetical protein CC_2597 [Caulobacter vibrioides CB15]